MGHYFESGVFGSNKAAWHGLGRVTGETLTAENILPMGDLDNWDVRKEPIYIGDGTLVPDQFALVRGKDGSIFGVVGRVYHPHQNEDMLGLVQALMGEGVTFETGISLKGGTIVTLLAHTEPYLVLGDEMKDYMALTNYHIGGARKTFWSSIRIVCKNTQQMAEADAKGTIWSCRHTKNSLATNEENLKKAREILRLAEKRPEKMKAFAEELVSIEVSDREFEMMMQRLFEYDAPKVESQLISTDKADREEGRKAREAFQEKRSLLWQAYRAPDLANFGSTGWGVLQSVTAYQSHVSFGVATTTKDVRRARTESRFLEVMESAPLEHKAVDFLYALKNG